MRDLGSGHVESACRPARWRGPAVSPGDDQRPALDEPRVPDSGGVYADSLSGYAARAMAHDRSAGAGDRAHTGDSRDGGVLAAGDAAAPPRRRGRSTDHALVAAVHGGALADPAA